MSPSTDPADLLRDIAVERVREAAPAGPPALYRCELGGQWNAAFFPFGGVVSALAVGAMRDELARPEHTPRTIHTTFCSPVADGPLEVEVRVLRAGRGMSQLQATVRAAGSDDAGATTVGVFGAPRPGFAFTDAQPPRCPLPEDCTPPEPHPDPETTWNARFFEQLEVRQWGMHASWEEGWEPGRAESLRWMRYRVPPRAADGSIDPLAYAPVCDTMPPSIIQALGPGTPAFFAPSCDLDVHFLQPTRDEWLLVQARTHHAGDGYASASIDLWDRDWRLVARATQLMYLRVGVTD